MESFDLKSASLQKRRKSIENNLSEEKPRFKKLTVEIRKREIDLERLKNFQRKSLNSLKIEKEEFVRKINIGQMSMGSFLTKRQIINQQSAQTMGIQGKMSLLKCANFLPQTNEELRELKVNANYEMKLHFVNEKHIFTFFNLIQKEKNINEAFINYTEFTKGKMFGEVLNFIVEKNTRQDFKKAFVFERIAIFVCVYLALTGAYNREIVFLKKIMALVFANSFIFIKLIISNEEKNVFAKEIEEIRQRKLILNEENVSENNEKLEKMLRLEVSILDPIIKGCFEKLTNFLVEFSVDEAFAYILNVFSEVVS